MTYAIVYFTKQNEEKKFEAKNDAELGAALNILQGAFFKEEVSNLRAVAIDEKAKTKVEMFNLAFDKYGLNIRSILVGDNVDH